MTCEDNGAHDLLLFDLDGTLSDPLPGIARSINHALAAFDVPAVLESELGRFIGPPIDETLAHLARADSKEAVARLVEKFRERFSDVGYSENTLYPGVRRALEQLHGRGVPLAVCTAKREDFAVKVLRMFGIDFLFRFVNGGDVGIRKTDQIRGLRSAGRVSSRTLMIGDRAVDLRAAHGNDLPSAGVLWGYGTREELEAEAPARLFTSPAEWTGLGVAT